MDGKNEFDTASSFLNNELSRLEERDWKSRYQNLSNLQPNDAWSFLNELLQNAVDFEASKIQIKYENKKLIFRHNADIKKYPLASKAIRGLCGIGESTKGLDSVGFMGIGFKFFIRYFSKVTICDKNVQFSISFNPQDRSIKQLQSLYQPTWINNKVKIQNGYSTEFTFEEILDQDLSKQLENALEDIDTKRFVTLAHRGLKNASIQDVVYDFSVNGKKSEAVIIHSIDNEGTVVDEWNYLVLEKTIEMSEEATDILKDVRIPLDADMKKQTNRTTRLIVEFNRDKKTDRLVMKPEEKGRLYCLVPLDEELLFPFKIGLDTDWFMGPDRKTVKSDIKAKKWHKELLNGTLPTLIFDYLNTLDNAGIERKKCTDIFPYNHKYSQAFQFLDENEFLDILKGVLENCKFILCADGKIRKPTEVRKIPELPSVRKKKNDIPMSKVTRLHILKKCFTVPIMDPSAISIEAVQYLDEKLELFEYPNSSEIVVEEIQKLWDKKNPSQYHHVLDLLSEIVPSDEQGLDVVPLSNDKWGPLYGSKLVFEYLPKKNGIEKPLLDMLKNNNSGIKDSKEVHHSLFGMKTVNTTYQWINSDLSGNKWKNKIIDENNEISLFDRSLKISELIEKLNLSRNLVGIKAKFRYAIRTNKPNLITYLHTQKGIKPTKECIISSPFSVGNILGIAPDLAISEELNDLMDKLPGPRIKKREMLIKAGAMHLVPSVYEKTLDDATEVTKFLGTKVGKDGLYISTWSASKTVAARVKNAWIVHEWSWPIEFHKLEMTAMSDYLSNPNKELRGIMESAEPKRWGSYFNNGPKKIPGTKEANWLTQLRDYEWVKCSDGIYRKPSNSPPPGSGEPHAELDLDVIDFYSDIGIIFENSMDDLDPEQCLDLWTKQPVMREKLFLRKLDNLKMLEAEKLEILPRILWRTHGGYFPHTPLSNFVHKPQSDLDGFIGDTGKIGEHVMEEFKKIGLQFPSRITPELAADFIQEISTKNKIREIFPQFEKSLPSAWQIILEDDFDIENIPVLDSAYNWQTIGQESHLVELVHDEKRHINFGIPVLLQLQFHPKISCMRKLYNSVHSIDLLDNELELLSNGEPNKAAINLSRIAFSLDLDYLFYSTGESVECDFRGEIIQIDYMIKEDNGKLDIYFSNNINSWREEICLFLINQDVKFKRFGTRIRKMMDGCSSQSFESEYKQFCNSANLTYFTYPEGIDKYGDIETILETDISSPLPKVSLPASVKIAEKKTDEDSTRKKKKPMIEKTQTGKKINESSHSKSVITEEDIQKKNTSKKNSIIENSRFSKKDIGDQAEIHVAEVLKKMGWKVSMMKENNPGYDITANKKGIERRIEVKGTHRNWVRVEMSHQQGLHFFKTVQDDNDSGEIEYWLCVVEYVLTEDSQAYNIKVWPEHEDGVTIHAINLSKAKPKHAFTKTHWEKRFSPDLNW